MSPLTSMDRVSWLKLPFRLFIVSSCLWMPSDTCPVPWSLLTGCHWPQQILTMYLHPQTDTWHGIHSTCLISVRCSWRYWYVGSPGHCVICMELYQIHSQTLPYYWRLFRGRWELFSLLNSTSVAFNDSVLYKCSLYLFTYLLYGTSCSSFVACTLCNRLSCWQLHHTVKYVANWHCTRVCEKMTGTRFS